MSTLTDITTIARWEVKKSFSMMSRDVLPLAAILFVLLVLVTGLTAQTGLHLQDGMYRVGVDDPQVAGLIAGDARFSVYQLDASTLDANRDVFDVIVVRGQASSRGTDKANAALKTLSRDYGKYVNSIYNSETDLFAAYPLWIDSESVKSETRASLPRRAASTSVLPPVAPHQSPKVLCRISPTLRQPSRFRKISSGHSWSSQMRRTHKSRGILRPSPPVERWAISKPRHSCRPRSRLTP